MNQDDAALRFSSTRVAVLATNGGVRPHLVPIVFAVEGNRIYTAVDHKPKTTRRLQRLINIEKNPSVALLAEDYDEDWEQLWWVRAEGVATIVDARAGAHGIDLLQQKYQQYQNRRPAGPVIVVTVARWSGWSARP
jgi:PPOX class probable F420-dependent enzyme